MEIFDKKFVRVGTRFDFFMARVFGKKVHIGKDFPGDPELMRGRVYRGRMYLEGIK